MSFGVVLWLNHIKGYGFIRSGDKDIFFHHTNTNNFHELKDGSEVELEIVVGEKGPKAMSVKLVK